MSAQVSFWNTTGLTGSELKSAIANARSQEEKVILIFRKYSRVPLGPSQVYYLGLGDGHTWLQSSVRRAMTTLTNDGYLFKTDTKRMGAWGAKEHTWSLTPPASQAPAE